MYQVFARDTAGNPSFLLVATAGSAPAPHVALTLPPAFDVYSGDALVTPFAARTRVECRHISVPPPSVIPKGAATTGLGAYFKAMLAF